MARTPRTAAPPQITGGQLQQRILDLCQLSGLATAHFRPAHTANGWRTPVAGDGKGFPDLVIVGAGGVLYREIKGVREQVTPEQATWLVRLAGAGQDAGVWRPADWDTGRIQAELQALRTPRRNTA